MLLIQTRIVSDWGRKKGTDSDESVLKLNLEGFWRGGLLMRKSYSWRSFWGGSYWWVCKSSLRCNFEGFWWLDRSDESFSVKVSWGKSDQMCIWLDFGVTAILDGSSIPSKNLAKCHLNDQQQFHFTQTQKPPTKKLNCNIQMNSSNKTLHQQKKLRAKLLLEAHFQWLKPTTETTRRVKNS